MLGDSMKQHFSVILVEPETAGNIGSVARVMKNFGFTHLVLVNPKVKDLTDAIIFSKHGYDVLESAIIVDNLSKLTTQYDLLIGTSAKTASDYNVLRSFVYLEDVSNILVSSRGKIGLVFGRESIGLTNDELNMMDFLITIPATEDYPVLNLSHAVAIVLYEIFKHKFAQSIIARRNPLASELEKKHLMIFFSNIVKSVTDDKVKQEIVIRSFRNVLGRSFITKREINSLLGIFRKVSQLLEKHTKHTNV